MKKWFSPRSMQKDAFVTIILIEIGCLAIVLYYLIGILTSTKTGISKEDFFLSIGVGFSSLIIYKIFSYFNKINE